MRLPLRQSLLAVLLVLQLVGIVAARFGPERLFCWAPYDEITIYTLEVVIDGRALSESEIGARYGLPASGRDNRSWANVSALIAHYERTYGASQHARVNYRYRVHGGPERVWSWPERFP